VTFDSALDVAAIELQQPLTATALTLNTNALNIAEPVGTWGFPSGYSSLAPLLTLGAIGGMDRAQSGALRLVINAAFNSGNSGGPLFRQSDGEVIGVVVSKLAPIPQDVLQILATLEQQKSGFQYTRTKPDGSTESVSEGALIAAVLKFLREQTQLVVGHATSASDLQSFLSKNGI